ncbi:ATP synthase F1 subunit gamma [Bacteroidota bacterium]
MDSLKDIRTRIGSVNSTRQITNAMKMVSAAKLRKAQKAIIQLRPYADKLYSILGSLSSLKNNSEQNEFIRKPEDGKVLIICIASNKGLCGAFNANVIRKTQELINSKYSDDFAKGNVYFSVIGKKLEPAVASKGWKLLSSNNDIYDKLEFDNVVPMAEKYMNLFFSKEFDKIELIYNKFKNTAVQEIYHEQFLPVNIDEQQNESDQVPDMIIEPDINYLTNKIVPLSLKIQLYKTILDSVASEHGARMTAMHIATDNATSIINELKLQYNKARQATITSEILEIVGGAEALKS